MDTFRDRIQAALLVNVRGFHSEDFHQSSAYQKIQSRFQNLQQWFASRDLSKLETLLGDYAWAEDEASLEALCQNFAAALQSAPQSFFDHGAFHCRMIANNVMERTWLFQQWQDRPKFPRMMLLTGSFSPALWTHEAVALAQDVVIVFVWGPAICKTASHCKSSLHTKTLWINDQSEPSPTKKTMITDFAAPAYYL